jgi:hypothetical protein
MFRLISMEPSSDWTFKEVLYKIYMFYWVRDFVLIVHNTFLKAQPEDGSIEVEPKQVAVKYHVICRLIIIA